MLKSLLVSFFIVFVASECPNGADYKSDLGYCIFPYNTEIDYASAVKACQRVNGNLISLHNLFQNILLSAYIDEYLSTQSTWLGVQSDQFQVWSWNDASQWDYEKWGKQEPIDGNHCAMLSLKDQNWHSMDCAEDRAAFLCAIPATPTTQNTITSTSDYL
ncbi:unnamed protein product, partial [Mesorhabditis belari]|uniref:C-type lectin domain-containing protein n=1 Tax=Mesorhabditis belari TaxID=2138241 RepID=A0AAF3EWY5_9BILA